MTKVFRYRVQIQPESDPDLSWLEQPEFAGEDPADHETAVFLLESECSCCGVWSAIDSLGNVDYLISKGGAPFGTVNIAVGPEYAPDAIEYRSVGGIALDEYSLSIIRDMIAEAQNRGDDEGE